LATFPLFKYGIHPAVLPFVPSCFLFSNRRFPLVLCHSRCCCAALCWSRPSLVPHPACAAPLVGRGTPLYVPPENLFWVAFAAVSLLSPLGMGCAPPFGCCASLLSWSRPACSASAGTEQWRRSVWKRGGGGTGASWSVVEHGCCPSFYPFQCDV